MGSVKILVKLAAQIDDFIIAGEDMTFKLDLSVFALLVLVTIFVGISKEDSINLSKLILKRLQKVVTIEFIMMTGGLYSNVISL